MRRKMVAVFRKRRFGFASETTIKELKKFSKNPNSKLKEYVFLAECMGDVVQTEIYCQQNQGKRARKAKQAT